MGACCTSQRGEKFNSIIVEHHEERERDVEDYEIIYSGDYGARVRLQGSSKLISMFTQQGRKGLNQDAMTVWENFGGEEDMLFCGVFDGHGPSGHRVARHVRDKLPSKLSSAHKQLQFRGSNGINDVNVDDDENENEDHDNEDVDENENENVDSKIDHDNEDGQSHNPFYSSWKASLLESFQDMDEDLEGEPMIDSYCSGTTAVTILKQGNHLMIANLGDSRAILCTRGNKDQLVSDQLTVDLKPNVPSEADRIKSCKGRILAMEEEPSVFRVWMPDQDCPGLAMARTFGDFCLKDFGIISIPQVFYRKLTDKDEFIVLATDGVWDVLSNNDVIRIVASARKRSMAARLLVNRAVRAWRYKYPSAKIDDCAVICLFLKRQRPLLTKSMSEVTELSLNYSELAVHNYPTHIRTEDGLETLLNCDVTEESKDGVTTQVEPAGDVSPVAGAVKRRRPTKDLEPIEN